MAFTLAQANGQLDLLSGFKNQLQRYGRTMSIVDSPGGQFPPTVFGLLTTLPMIDPRLALGEDPSEANLTWLKDVSARLESLDGTEALIEGFGELSGRFRRSV